MRQKPKLRGPEKSGALTQHMKIQGSTAMPKRGDVVSQNGGSTASLHTDRQLLCHVADRRDLAPWLLLFARSHGRSRALCSEGHASYTPGPALHAWRQAGNEPRQSTVAQKAHQAAGTCHMQQDPATAAGTCLTAAEACLVLLTHAISTCCAAGAGWVIAGCPVEGAVVVVGLALVRTAVGPAEVMGAAIVVAAGRCAGWCAAAGWGTIGCAGATAPGWFSTPEPQPAPDALPLP